MIKITKIEDFNKLEEIIKFHFQNYTEAEIENLYSPIKKCFDKAKERAFKETNDINTIDIWYINWWFGQKVYNLKKEEDKELYSDIWKDIIDYIEKKINSLEIWTA